MHYFPVDIPDGVVDWTTGSNDAECGSGGRLRQTSPHTLREVRHRWCVPRFCGLSVLLLCFLLQLFRFPGHSVHNTDHDKQNCELCAEIAVPGNFRVLFPELTLADGDESSFGQHSSSTIFAVQ